MVRTLPITPTYVAEQIARAVGIDREGKQMLTLIVGEIVGASVAMLALRAIIEIFWR